MYLFCFYFTGHINEKLCWNLFNLNEINATMQKYLHFVDFLLLHLGKDVSLKNFWDLCPWQKNISWLVHRSLYLLNHDFFSFPLFVALFQGASCGLCGFCIRMCIETYSHRNLLSLRSQYAQTAKYISVA